MEVPAAARRAVIRPAERGALAALGADHHMACQVLSLTPGFNTLNLLHRRVNNAALVRVHGLKGAVALGFEKDTEENRVFLLCGR